MKLRLTVIAGALSALSFGSVYAGGTDGCDQYQSRYTSAEPQEETAATDKIAALGEPAASQTTASEEKAATPQPAEQTTSQ